MSGVWIRTRRASGSPRYLVGYRLGGRATTEQHAGTFKTLREARARQEYVRLEIASGRDPKRSLAELARPTTTLEAVAEAWIVSRVDLRESSVILYRTAIKSLLGLEFLARKDPRQIEPADVQAAVNKLSEERAPATVRLYVGTVLAGILDYAGVDPNPVRSRQVRFPKVEPEIPVIPSGEDVDTMIACMPVRVRLLTRLLERTGMRVSEACSLEWQDVDTISSRVRVRKGKTRSATRWVVVPLRLMTELDELLPREDRVAARRIFPSTDVGVVERAMRRACVHCGLAHYHPHDLRHRYASMLGRMGVPRAVIARQLGHAKISQLDVYEHVVFDVADDELREWQELAAQMLGREIVEVPA